MRHLKQFRYYFIFPALCLGLIFSGGCWDAKELADLAIVSAIGIDLDQKQPGNVLITIQVIKPEEVKSVSGGVDSRGGGGLQSTGQRQAFLMVSSSGKTVSEAIRNFVSIMDREIYLSQNQIIIFSQTAVRQGILSFLDYFIRTRQCRETTWIVVTNGKANDVLKTNLGLEKISAIEINRLIINRETASQASAATLHEFAIRLLSKTPATYTSFIQLREHFGDKRIRLIGTAVFKGDKLVGELDKTETRGFLWIINKVGKGIITVKSFSGAKIDLGIIKAHSKIIPEIRNGRVNIRLVINAECGLISETYPEDFLKPNATRQMEVLLRQAIRKEVKAALNKTFQLNADVFGFKEAVHRKFPREWKMMESNWDQLFLTTKVRMKINAKLKSVGLNVRPLFAK